MRFYQLLLICLVASLVICCENDSTESLLAEFEARKAQNNPPMDTISKDSIPKDTIPKDTVVVIKTTYNADIKPIIDANCAVSTCHVSPGPRAGVSLETYGDVKSWSDRVVHRINFAPSPMPPSSRRPLSQAEKDLIAKWVEDGLLEN